MDNSLFIAQELRLDGNNLCLNFINTIFDRKASETRDLIESKYDWSAWLKRVGLLDEIIPNIDESRFSLNILIELRTLFYNVFSALAQNQKPEAKDIKAFEKWIGKSQRVTCLSLENGKFIEKIETRPNDLNSYLFVVVKSAKQLLLSGQLHRIKDCGHCGWLYWDTSKNNSRKWCSMSVCGSQIKAKRYYQNKKKSLTS